MILFDLILILILGGFVLYGLWFGLINTLGVLVGTIAGAFLAARWYEPVADWAGFLFGGHTNLAKVVCFLILFIIINRLVGLVFWLIDKIFSFFKIIPFL
ncbi:CvpA family protein, partial [Patescibacteria group bacterium]|nr:CvpA family protein [Patescibacteria group bacterium]